MNVLSAKVLLIGGDEDAGKFVLLATVTVYSGMIFVFEKWLAGMKMEVRVPGVSPLTSAFLVLGDPPAHVSLSESASEDERKRPRLR